MAHVQCQWLQNAVKNRTPRVSPSAEKIQNPRNQETKKQKKQKKQNDKTQLSATTPPLGCAIFFFGFLFSGSLLVF